MVVVKVKLMMMNQQIQKQERGDMKMKYEEYNMN